MKKGIFAIILVVLAIGIFAFLRLSTPNISSFDSSGSSNDGVKVNLVGFDDKGGERDDDYDDDNYDDKMIDSGSTSSASTGSSISLEELSTHNSQSDCWVAYDGKVYDVTSFLPKHPGSAAAIAPHCGTQQGFTSAFTKKHGTSKVSMLMKVGTLMGDFEIVGSA